MTFESSSSGLQVAKTFVQIVSHKQVSILLMTNVVVAPVNLSSQQNSSPIIRMMLLVDIVFSKTWLLLHFGVRKSSFKTTINTLID